MGNDHSSENQNMIGSLSEVQLDAATQQIINVQNSVINSTPLGFHSLHGTNVAILENGRMARRKQSFCKGLAFSNRPIEIRENVCIRLTEVSNNWSGVLRFGVTNIDPETFRSQVGGVPKFACPDLTSKDGYWAKALPERYSIQNNILHFYVNTDGELFYGINGRQKGIFLTGINTHLPLWIIVDIYGNSVALEFVEASEFRRLSQPLVPTIATFQPTSSILSITPTLLYGLGSSEVNTENTRNSLDGETRHESSAASRMISFHEVCGRHIALDVTRRIATRDQAEYSQGYVFTERPIRSNEAVSISIKTTQPLYGGGVAFGVTCCNPEHLRSTDMPDNSADVIEMPEYWVVVKDIAHQPSINTTLRFWITDSGEVKYEKYFRDELVDTARTILHVDNSIDLYMFFDVYGSTTSIKLLPISDGTRPFSTRPRPVVAPRPALPAPEPVIAQPPENNGFTAYTITPSGGLRVDMRPFASARSASTTPSSSQGAYNTYTSNLISSHLSSQTPSIPSAHSAADVTSWSTRPYVNDVAPFRPPPPPIPRRTQRAPIDETISNMIAKKPEKTKTVQNSDGKQGGGEDDGDCLICFDAQVNCVLYTCGHMCLCFECAQRLRNHDNSCCPICRAEIRDVIRCFKS